VDSELAVELTYFDFNSLRDGSVHSVALSWDNTNGDWSVYVDGEIADQGWGVAVNQSLDGGVGLGNLVFGQELDSIDGDFDPEQIFSGTLYDVRIWNEVRSSAEIAQNYQHKLDLSPDEAISLGLLANWQFEFNDENEVVDIVSANDLVVRNAIGTGFVPSTPTGNLHVSEHALAGATVGTVVPSDPNVYNDIVRDGLFTEVPNPGVQQQFSAGESFGEWTVESGSVDLLGTLIGSSPLGGRSVDLNGTAAGTISQALETVPGRQY